MGSRLQDVDNVFYFTLIICMCFCCVFLFFSSNCYITVHACIIQVFEIKQNEMKNRLLLGVHLFTFFFNLLNYTLNYSQLDIRRENIIKKKNPSRGG